MQVNCALPYQIEETNKAKLINSFKNAEINIQDECVETKSIPVKPNDKKPISVGEFYNFRIDVNS